MMCDTTTVAKDCSCCFPSLLSISLQRLLPDSHLYKCYCFIITLGAGFGSSMERLEQFLLKVVILFGALSEGLVCEELLKIGDGDSLLLLNRRRIDNYTCIAKFPLQHFNLRLHHLPHCLRLSVV